MLLYVLIALFWLASVVVALALCKAAARGDRQLGYDTDPYELRQKRLKVQRALQREGIVPLGKTRVGIDRR